MTILESAPIMAYAHLHIWMIPVGLFIALISLIFAKVCDEVRYDIASIIFAFIFILGFICFIAGAWFEITEPEIDTGRIQYTVKCDDSISLNEFYNKYKILEHTKYTDVYVVEEIND